MQRRARSTSSASIFSVVTAENAEDNANYLNHLTLLEGEFRTKATTDADGNEVPLAQQVVAERPNNYFEDAEIGDKIVIADDLDTANSTYGDIYPQRELTVVGIVSSPDYYYKDGREVTTVGTGVVSLVIYGNYSVSAQTDEESGETVYVADTENNVYDMHKSAATPFSVLNMELLGPIRGIPCSIPTCG